MARILLVTWDRAGNLPPVPALARALDPGLHDAIGIVEELLQGTSP